MASRGMMRRSPIFSTTTIFFFFFSMISSSMGAINIAAEGDGDFSVAAATVGEEVTGICASLVIPNGYMCQEFDNVRTRDGYILGVQRIREGRVEDGLRKERPPVLLQHGLLMDGMTWVLNSPDQSLAYILADSGFDVWIANTRGTRWSRRHVALTSSTPAYWSWSWDELVMYDLPATFDFVYQQTGKRLHYIGHSLGTLLALASFSEGRLLDKLRSAALLSPIAYLSHMTTPLGIIAAKTFVGEITRLLGITEFDPKGVVGKNLLNSICHSSGVDCYNLMSSITGVNCCLNKSTVELFLKYEPQSTSTKNMVHLAQTFRDGILAKYDYGDRFANMRHYGQGKPPVYNLSSIPNDLPLFLSYGGKDSLSSVQDVNLLLDNLKFHDADKLTVQYVANYAHADFVMGVSANQIVYNAIIAFFNRQK